MLLNRTIPLYFRLASAIPVAVLVAFMVTIWWTFVFLLSVPLLTANAEYAGVPFGVSSVSRIVLIVAILAVHAMLVPLSLSLFRVVTSSPGHVPTWYKTTYRRLSRFFLEQTETFASLASGQSAALDAMRASRRAARARPSDSEVIPETDGWSDNDDDSGDDGIRGGRHLQNQREGAVLLSPQRGATAAHTSLQPQELSANAVGTGTCGASSSRSNIGTSAAGQSLARQSGSRNLFVTQGTSQSTLHPTGDPSPNDVRWCKK